MVHIPCLLKWADMNNNLLRQPQQDTKLEKPGRGNQQWCPLSAPLPHHDISHLGAGCSEHSWWKIQRLHLLFLGAFLAWPDFALRVRIIRSVAYWGHLEFKSQKVAKYLILTIDVIPRAYGLLLEGCPVMGCKWIGGSAGFLGFFPLYPPSPPLDFKTSF